MEERKLNFNAPLLSVRRFSAALGSSKGEKDKKSGNSVLQKRNSLPVNRSDASLDQVTEPVTVPFTWEHIPGKAKDETETVSKRCSEKAAVVPRLPPRRHFDVKGNETCCANEKGGFDSENEEEDAYSDALNTLSQTESLSLNCSVSGLSGSGVVVSKPLGTVSTDPQARDFMMSRFLPAAKAMAMESPQYAIKKQPQAQPVEQQQPRESRQVVYADRKSPLNLYESMVVPHYDRGLDAEETESEDDEYIASSNLSRKGCGFFPKLCFKNSLCLLNPVPILKVRSHSSLASLAKAGKSGKSAYIESQSQVLKKEARIASDKQKSSSRAQSPVKRIGSKLSSALSKFNYSGELQPKLDYGARSPKVTKIVPAISKFNYSGELQHKLDHGARSPRVTKIGPASSKFTYSGELYRKLDYGAQSPKVPVIVRKVSSVSNHYLNSIEQQQQQADSGVKSPKVPVMVKKLSSVSNHFPNSVEQQQTSDSGAKSLKLPNLSDEQTSRSSSPRRSSGGRHISPYRRERPQSPFRGGGFLGLPKEAENVGSKSHELSYHQSFRQGSGSVSPAIDKSLYVDTENFAEVSSVRPSLPGRNGKREFTSKSGPLLRCRVLGETAASENRNFSTEVDLEEDNFVECEGSPAPPPLPRKPSESWLRRALPSVPSQNQFTRTYTGSRFHPKQEETKAANSKWETIVKTSYLHHDHVRYSEELVTHVSQQPRN